MGEYILYNGRKTKIGSCEELMYVSFERYLGALRQGILDQADNNAPPLCYVLPASESLYRLPYPDEFSLRFGDPIAMPVRNIPVKISSELYLELTGRIVDSSVVTIALEYQKLIPDPITGKLMLGLVLNTQDGLFRVRDESLARALHKEIRDNKQPFSVEKEARLFVDALMAKVLEGYQRPFFTPGDDRSKHILADRAVAVHPELTNDPYNCRGKVGTVIGIQHDRSDRTQVDALVNFSGATLGLYQSDALLTLYPESVIHQGLVSNAGNLPAGDQALILQILKLQRNRKHLDALTMALKNATTLFYCTTSCSNWLELNAPKALQKRNGLKNK